MSKIESNVTMRRTSILENESQRQIKSSMYFNKAEQVLE